MKRRREDDADDGDVGGEDGEGRAGEDAVDEGNVNDEDYEPEGRRG